MSGIPDIEEIKLLVKNIYNTSLKLNGEIKINTIHDAANLAAYLYGFSSWNEYQALLNKENEFIQKEVYSFKMKKFKAITLLKEEVDDLFNEYFLLSSTKEPKASNLKSSLVEIKKSNMLPLEWLIGNWKEKKSKVANPVGLLPKSYIVQSSNNKEIYQLFKTNLEWLSNNRQSFFIFGLDDKDFINTLKNQYESKEGKLKLYEIGLNSFKIDPISEALKYDNLEAILGLNNNQEIDNFSILWLMLIRTFYEELNYCWDAESLLNSIQLNFLIGSLERIKKINEVLYITLHQYLFKKCLIKKVDNEYQISEEGQEKHYKITYILREKLEKIHSLYKKGYFSKATQMSLFQLILQKNSALFLECEDSQLRKEYWNICHVTYINAHKRYEELLNKEQLDYSLYKVWSLWWNAHDKIQKNIASNILNIQNTQIICSYIINHEYSEDLDPWYENINQILFLKQFIKDISSSWKKKALFNTELWEENLWFNNYEILRNLKNDEAYLWTNKNLNHPTGIEVYEFKKINLYLKNIQ